MKFRTMLLASAAVMFATSSFAADITNPFYLPSKGKVLSNTSVQTSREKLNFGTEEDISKDLMAAEEVSFGVMDNLALVGKIANTFDYDKDKGLNNDHNFDYEIGAKYNMTYGKVLSQFGLAYRTMNPESWYGQNYNNENEEWNGRWKKGIKGEVKLGYAFDCGLTPYTSFTVDGDIDSSNNEQEYTWFVGAYKKLDNVSVDAGVVYNFGKEAEGDGEGWTDNNYESWYAAVSANYFVKDNMTVGVYGDYYLGGRERKDVDYDYTVGLNAKVLF